MKLVDNLLPEEDFKSLQEIVLGNEIPYYFQNSVLELKDCKDKSNVNQFYFTHTLFENNRPASLFFDIFNEKLFKKLYKFAIYRAKINCYPRTDTIVHHDKHTDHVMSHKGLVLSFNTCDGCTVLEDGTMIESVANRGLFFDSSKEHNSTTCTNAKARFNININYI